ncbi:MAG: type I DNA topoisomerase [Holosporales bacterium]|nr:type I DNA topoisomerase [Holosporales bacterium]
MKKEEKLVIVESPAKASTIERYLGPGFNVLASYGHVRDLLSKSGSVDPNNDFKMIWAESEKSHKRVNDILNTVKSSQQVFLATDPDREGEAIAWHVSELITQKYGDKAPDIQRVVFHEITKNAVLSAMQTPRKIDKLLVDAYLARRALDYLVGYSISPILWQKLPGSRSAGRVQSVALRLIVEREQEIEKFKSQEYWSIDGDFSTEDKKKFQARLYSFNSKKLAKLDIKNAQQVKQMCDALKPLVYSISTVEKKQVQRNPAPPFTTSTMQQEASRKLGFGTSRTMRIAQYLYEGVQISGEKTGLITYMRTDSVNLSKEGIANFREFIQKNYGNNYLPKDARIYKTKTKNAQEAHEAIRPTNITRRPSDLVKFLDKDQLTLYELIWKRAIASQMENALFDQVTVDISDKDKKHIFRAVGTTQIFDGFLKIYQEGVDDIEEADGNEEKLPLLKESDKLSLNKLVDLQHFTQPLPRFTEASLVKKLEELGIGRPSTYAPLIQVLQDRGYALLEKRQFIPSDRGYVVTTFLTNFCRKYVEYDFTAHMEDELDDISNGELEWKKVMSEFWEEFSATIGKMKAIPVTEIINKLEEDLKSYIFKNLDDKKCEKCGRGVIGLKLSKYGAFLGCSNYPECTNRKPIGIEPSEQQYAIFEPKELGIDPEDGAKISLRKGPYGFYIQADFDENSEEKVEKIGKKTKKTKKKVKNKKIGIPPSINPQEITFQEALFLKNLPKTVGKFEGKDVKVSTGRFGPYVMFEDIFASIPKALNFMKITLDEAIKLIEKKRAKPPRARRSISKKKTPS